jgi:nodulation protein E
VVITGLGVVSALGPNRDTSRTALRHGRSGIAPLEGVPAASFGFQQAAQVRTFDPSAHFGPRDLELCDRFTQFPVVAAREAVADARLPEANGWRARAAIMLCTGAGGQSTQERASDARSRGPRLRVHPFTIPKSMSSAATSRISMEMAVTVPALTVSTACSSASHAIALGLQQIRFGMADVALTGGSEAPFFRALDPECGLDVVPNSARPATVEAALSNSLSFDGLNAVLAFRRWRS